MQVPYTLYKLDEVTDDVKHCTSSMTDKQLTEALTLNDRISIHLHFEALLRIREAQRGGFDAYPFPVQYRD